jgi:mono/diheme cytochrome c family protein
MGLPSTFTRVLFVCCVLGAGDASAAGEAASRGQLLYETHCTACHSTQMHWRDQRRVDDWASLLAQVGQWQARERLNWTREDIAAVARHLDRTIYRLGDTPARGE